MELSYSSKYIIADLGGGEQQAEKDEQWRLASGGRWGEKGERGEFLIVCGEGSEDYYNISPHAYRYVHVHVHTYDTCKV